MDWILIHILIKFVLKNYIYSFKFSKIDLISKNIGKRNLGVEEVFIGLIFRNKKFKTKVSFVDQFVFHVEI